MTLDEFKATLLAESRHKWAGVNESGGEIRDERGFCPLCSLAWDRGWDWVWAYSAGRDPNSSWESAATHLGIDLLEAEKVITAADFDDHLLLDREIKSIREWLNGLTPQGETT